MEMAGLASSDGGTLTTPRLYGGRNVYGASSIRGIDSSVQFTIVEFSDKLKKDLLFSA